MNAATAPARARVFVAARDSAVRDRVLAVVRRCGFEPVAEPEEVAGVVMEGEVDGAVVADGLTDTVVLVAGRTVGDAMAECPAPILARGGWLLIADAFAPSEALRAVRAGAAAMLRAAHLTPERLAAAVQSACRGDGMIPYEVLVRVLGGVAGEGLSRKGRATPTALLTHRQLTVLALIADGHGNASIARSLACSQHTVKNVIYDMTARLQVRNRAQAVACGVRAGLI